MIGNNKNVKDFGKRPPARASAKYAKKNFGLRMTRIKLCQKIITALQYICNHEISCYINIMQYHAIPHTVQGNIHTFEKVYLTRTRTNTVEKKRIEKCNDCEIYERKSNVLLPGLGMATERLELLRS